MLERKPNAERRFSFRMARLFFAPAFCPFRNPKSAFRNRRTVFDTTRQPGKLFD